MSNGSASTAMIPEHDNEWWGFSQTHGWVLVDWNDPRNRPGFESPRRLYLIRCQDWAEIPIRWSTWTPPGYVSTKDRIAALPAHSRESALEQIGALQETFYSKTVRRQDLLSQLRAQFQTDFLNVEEYYPTFRIIPPAFTRFWVGASSGHARPYAAPSTPKSSRTLLTASGNWSWNVRSNCPCASNSR